MDCQRATGWWPWIPYDARDIAQSPYGYVQVELGREEWDAPQTVDPRALDPMTNVVDLWWRPVSPAVYEPWPFVDTASPIVQALALALRYGQIAGAHHKTWVIDQMVRALLQTPEAYAAWVADACAGDDGPDSYDWNVGIPP